ncbi:MAG: biopolymer transporter ExbD [Acidobacteria bacterium]|nr:biopolymer transporter ExbD [Acidobacteriota bacterium]
MPKILPAEPSSGGRRRGRRVATSLAEINVIPLVDVMLVLLIIFMVTAPMLQRGIEINLPTSRRAAQVSEERVFVTVPLSYRENHVVQIGNERIRVEVLEERMRQSMLGKNEKEVFLRSDGGIFVQELVDVMGHLKAAGVERVGIVAKLPGER